MFNKILAQIQTEYEQMMSSQGKSIPSPIKMHKVSRLYVDGCFDLMHSGHYNALRQVILKLRQSGRRKLTCSPSSSPSGGPEVL